MVDRTDGEVSIGAALRFGWRRLVERPGQCLWLGTAGAVVGGAQRGLDDLLTALAEQFPVAGGWIDGVAVVTSLLVAGLGFMVDLNVVRASLALTRTGSSDVRLFSVPEGWLTYSVAKLAMMLAVVLGALLLFVPGLMALARYPFAGLLIVDRGLGARAALAEGARLGRGARWTVLGFCLAAVVLNVVGFACLIVGVFATRAVTVVAFAHFYDQLRERERRLSGGAVVGPPVAELVVPTAMGPVAVDVAPFERR